MKSRVSLSLLALAGLATGVPFVMHAPAGGAGGGRVAGGASSLTPSVFPIVRLWFLVGVIGIGVGILAICLIRRAPADGRSSSTAPEALPDSQSAAA